VSNAQAYVWVVERLVSGGEWWPWRMFLREDAARRSHARANRNRTVLVRVRKYVRATGGER
jgi:hypothetical protein